MIYLIDYIKELDERFMRLEKSGGIYNIVMYDQLIDYVREILSKFPDEDTRLIVSNYDTHVKKDIELSDIDLRWYIKKMNGALKKSHEMMKQAIKAECIMLWTRNEYSDERLMLKSLNMLVNYVTKCEKHQKRPELNSAKPIDIEHIRHWCREAVDWCSTNAEILKNGEFVHDRPLIRPNRTKMRPTTKDIDIEDYIDTSLSRDESFKLFNEKTGMSYSTFRNLCAKKGIKHQSHKPHKPHRPHKPWVKVYMSDYEFYSSLKPKDAVEKIISVMKENGAYLETDYPTLNALKKWRTTNKENTTYDTTTDTRREDNHDLKNRRDDERAEDNENNSEEIIKCEQRMDTREKESSLREDEESMGTKKIDNVVSEMHSVFKTEAEDMLGEWEDTMANGLPACIDKMRPSFKFYDPTTNK